jgi:hypothetical protein
MEKGPKKQEKFANAGLDIWTDLQSNGCKDCGIKDSLANKLFEECLPKLSPHGRFILLHTAMFFEMVSKIKALRFKIKTITNTILPHH